MNGNMDHDDLGLFDLIVIAVIVVGMAVAFYLGV